MNRQEWIRMREWNDKLEITIEEWKTLAPEQVELIDVRDAEASAYGHIPGALCIPADDLEDAAVRLSKDTMKVVYCKRGEISRGAVLWLQENGFTAYSLAGGYNAYLLDKMKTDTLMQEDRVKQIEKSIQKKFHKELFTRFAKAINAYDMLHENDHVAVCISGGKDSMLMAKLFQELQRHRKFPFQLTFLVMDPGYNETNRKLIESNARLMNIPITVFESEIFDAVDQVEKSPCYLCARMRRGYLYSKAKELGCNKIALGHHYDDVIETTLMGMLYGGQMQTMMPKLHSTNFEGMELIRPMYLIREADIIHWRDYNDLQFLQCACHFTENCSSCREDGTSKSKRLEIKNMIASMKKVNPFVESNIFRSTENVNLNTLICYKKNGVRHSFLETYDQDDAIEE